ncbi:hypothetical protein EB061_02470 [bacterium]|nr:hypothetical protein [bacterium]
MGRIRGICAKGGLILVFALLPSWVARATVLVNPPTPFKQRLMGENSYTIAISGSDDGTIGSGSFYNATRGYRFINTTLSSDANLVWLDVSSNQNFTVNAGQHIVVTLSTGTSSGTEIPLIGAGMVTTNSAPPACGTGGVATCQGSRSGASNLSAAYEAGKVLRISFSIQALCQTSGATGNLCGASAPNYSNFQTAGSGGATLSQSFVVTFSVVNDYVSTGAVSGTGNDSGTFTLQISNIPPVISCPTSGQIADYYFPGDGQIYLTPTKYPYTAGSGASSAAGAAVTDLTFLASRGGVALFSGNSVPSNEVVAYVDVGKGTQAISGFLNSTNGADNVYRAAVYAQNEVGILSATACSLPSPYITSQSIRGMLSKSKCFIATAAYHDADAAPVRMLRRFRDRVLSRFELGRRFISDYYKWSPAWAEWAWDKPFVRSLVLRALVPVELIAWALLEVAHGEESSSPQPYIDRLKKQLEKSSENPAPSYTEEFQKSLQPREPETSYTEKIKASLDPEQGVGQSAAPGSESYTESEKKKLPGEAERESPIQAVLAGKSVTTEPKRPDISHALGFMVGVNPNISVSDPNGSFNYSTIYGSGWQPELLMHYEWQPGHSEYFGSFGFHLNTGITYGQGYGQLSFPFNGSTVSQTKFTFLQVPMMIGATYRFNLLRLIRPYIGADVGAILYNESRRDDVGDKRGYSTVYSGHLGAALLLDYFDGGSARDGYLSTGIQHSYFVAEFMYLDTFSKSSVVFKRSGVYAGFLFEI